MKKKKLNIIYEDKNIIVVDKPTHLLTIATEKEKEKTLYHEVLEYEKCKHKSNRIFIVHRLDRDTSGLILFAKSEKYKQLFQDNWSDVKREYIALIEGVPKKKHDIIKSYLKENKSLITYSTKNKKDGREAITEYEVIKSNKNISLVKINILTGRKNQIRVHMSEMGHPIVGDKKYGAKYNFLKRMALHANKLEYKDYKFESKVPFSIDI